MGIQTLLPFLAESAREAHISEFENKFVAIDAYCWLHRGIYSCAFEIATNKPTVKYVTYCMRYIEMLLHFNVKPILVFDGRQLSSKRETENKRREERRKKYERGRQLMRAGNYLEGRRLLGESVDVTHELALKLIQECRRKNIDCIVAPYEADAQLAFLSLRNIVHCVITEDSDLLAYGSERVMFKMDSTGRGKLIEKSQIHVSLKMTAEEFNEDIFRYMCILIGCDYLPSLVTIGPVNALKFVKLLNGNDIYDVLPKLPIYLNKLKVTVTPEYIAGFRVADNTFKHQLVYDPFLRSQVPLRPVINVDDIVGTMLPDGLAFDLAVGNIDPMTMKKLDNYDPDQTGRGFSHLWRTDMLPSPKFDQCFTSLSHSAPQREIPKYNAVLTPGNDINKKRNPFSISGFRKSKTKITAQNIPDCGFIFDPKIEKKNVSNGTDQSNLLKSRYFSRAITTAREKNKKAEGASDRKKDESDEEYLQRLYNEYFPLGESESEESEEKKVGSSSTQEVENAVLEEFCLPCGKDRTHCTCLSENTDVSGSQTLGECNRDSEEPSKINENSSAQHFLLDEIYKSQIEKSKEDKREEEKGEGKVTSSQSLSLNFSKILSKFAETPKSRMENEISEMEVVEKENTEVVYVGEQESERSPSPVFKVQRSVKVLKRNCGLGNISDTAGTPTSVYFSSPDLERLNTSNPQVSSRQTPFSRKMPSLRAFNSVPSKTAKNDLKNSTVNGTLFQFGFKKRRREENESEV